MSFDLRISSFAVCWLRAYDFGMEQSLLEKSLPNLNSSPLISQITRLSNPHEIDEVDRKMFDVRYQGRSNLVRIHFAPIQLVAQSINHGRCLDASLSVNFVIDLASGFGVINISLAQLNLSGSECFAIEEIGFLTRQWLLTQDDQGQPARLNIQLPGSNEITRLYIREVMNYFYLHLHYLLWGTVENLPYPQDLKMNDSKSWIDLCSESDPQGCEWIHRLYQEKLVRSLYPTSFGPVLDVWGIDGIDPKDFDADQFAKKYSGEISWLFTDGTRMILGEDLSNERRTKFLALYIWPNHALYINQHPESISPERVHSRVRNYGCLDVEIVRIIEILTLQHALLRAYDRQLDQQLENISTIAVGDQSAFIELTQERRDISRSMRSFDFFNLFHTAYWEPLYAGLLANPHLSYEAAKDLLELKSKRLDEEVQNALLIQDRARQQQQREQEIDVLRGLHNLSLANDIQSSALLGINFIVSATASFAFTEVIAPLLTKYTGAYPSFQQAFPLQWVGINLGIFLLVVGILFGVSSSLVHFRSQIIELEGRLDLQYNPTRLKSYLSDYNRIKYYHYAIDDGSGYLRIKLKNYSLILEFNHDHFYRYILVLQTGKKPNIDMMKKKYVETEIEKIKAFCV